jgi:Domain of unknown function (DUF3387)./FRG domain.
MSNGTDIQGLIPSTSYFDKVPAWTSIDSNKRFEVISDEISGRIPVTRIKHWREFLGLIEDPFFNRSGTKYVFRGHRRFDWGLMPSLGRLSENGIVTQELAEAQLSKFRQTIRGRIDDRTLLESYDDKEQNDELWAIGQHHGLLTPLLDWTYSPYVALFFSFAKADVKGEKDNPYRVVYLLNKTFIENPELGPDIRVFEPRKDDYGRLVNQAGLFTFSPYDSTIENRLSDLLSDPEFADDALRNADEDKQAEILARYICKIYICNDDRDGCLRYLRKMNIHHASLFPDLLGASDYCNLLAEEESKERLLKKNKSSIDDSRSATISVPAIHSIEDPVSETASSLEEILQSSIGTSQVEEAKLKTIAEELSKAFAQEKAVDWKDRDSAQARLRVVAKVILRKFGYPAEIRDATAEKLVLHISSKD